MSTNTPAATRPMEPHFPELDGLRGIAILSVLICHFSGILLASSQNPAAIKLYWFLLQGSHGVDLFFVLSGFLISGKLLDSRGSSTYFRSFWWRRVLRICPLYYAYLALVFLIIYPSTSRLGLGDLSEYKPAEWPYLIYGQNWTPSHGMNEYLVGHFWSLAVEEQFYLVWPLVIYFAPRRLTAPLCIAVAAGAVLLRCVLAWQGYDYITIYRITPARLDTLMIGALIAVAIRNQGWANWLQKWGKTLFAVSLLAVIACVLVVNNYSPGFDKDPRISTLGLFLVAILSGAAVVMGLQPKTWVASVFRNRVLMSFGKISYGIYVYHVLFVEIAPNIFYKIYWQGITLRVLQICYIPAMIACSYGIAWLSYRYFERRFLRMKNRF